MTGMESAAKANPFPYDDEEFRRELSDEIRLKDIPSIDNNAYDELHTNPNLEFLGKLTGGDVADLLEIDPIPQSP